MPITRARLREGGFVVQIMDDGSEVPLQVETDWARVDAMTDEEIERAAADDPDAPPLTDEQLAAGRMVGPADIAATRRRLGLSQTEFAT